MLKRVIASALHRLPRTSVENHRFPPVEKLVTALHQQKVALRLRHAYGIECLELGKMIARELVALTGDRLAMVADTALWTRTKPCQKLVVDAAESAVAHDHDVVARP